MQPQGRKAVRYQCPNGSSHIPLAGKRRTNPVPDTARLRHAATNIGNRQSSNHRVVVAAEYQESISQIAALIFGVSLEPAAESAAREIVSRPNRLHGTRKRRLVSRNAAHSAKSPLCGGRNVTPAPVMLGTVSLELTVRKNAMDVSRSCRAADQTFGDRSCRFKAIARSERGDRRPGATDQGAPARTGALDGHCIDLGDNLLKRNRTSIGEHLPRELAYTGLGAFQRHQKTCFHLG